jgi:hypothetical protein
MLKTIDEWKKNWLYLLCLYLESNYEKIKSAEVVDATHVLINGESFKADINEYTGSEPNYIFFNTSSGRIHIERPAGKIIDRLEVTLV